MAKTKKAKKHTSGANYAKYNALINKNPILRETRKLLLLDLQNLRETILEECMNEIDAVREKLELNLIYDDSSLLDSIKGIAKNNPDKYIGLLRTTAIGGGDFFKSLPSRLINVKDNLNTEKLPEIIKRAGLLKPTSIIQTSLEFHNRILIDTIKVLKNLAYEELDVICLKYIESYSPEDELIEEESIEHIEENIEVSYNSERLKMMTFRELNSFAVDNGFIFVRQRGDHAIYRNSAGYITVIPQRAMGRGLQMEILKQITRNKH